MAVLGLAVLGLTHRGCLFHVNPEPQVQGSFYFLQFSVSGHITVTKQNYILGGDFCLKVWAACVLLEFINCSLKKCVPCCESLTIPTKHSHSDFWLKA